MTLYEHRCNSRILRCQQSTSRLELWVVVMGSPRLLGSVPLWSGGRSTLTRTSRVNSAEQKRTGSESRRAPDTSRCSVLVAIINEESH
jgi:hypothetical protein